MTVRNKVGRPLYFKCLLGIYRAHVNVHVYSVILYR